MKFLNYLILGLFISGVALTSSCKKEDRIEKNLWNKGGEWNIESYSITQVSSNPIDNFSETFGNAGMLTFTKNGTGIYKFTIDGEVESGAFTYSNTEDKLTLIIDNEIRIFDLEWKKDDVQISIVENYTSSGAAITYTEIIKLKKK